MRPNLTLTNIITCLAMLLGLSACASIPARPWTELPAGSTFDTKGEYLIGPLDDLNVLIVGQDQLSGPMAVTNKGTLAMALAGEVPVAGLTIKQAARALETALAPYLKSPVVNVSVAARRSYRVHFAGQVARVGQIQFDAAVNILEGLAQAGGLTPFATGRIVLIRTTAGSSVRYAVDYNDLLKGRTDSDLARLERGDYVFAE